MKKHRALWIGMAVLSITLLVAGTALASSLRAAPEDRLAAASQAPQVSAAPSPAPTLCPTPCEPCPESPSEGKDGARKRGCDKLGGFFSGDFFEANKDKTLSELRDDWLAIIRAQLDEAVTSGRMTQKEADKYYAAAENGDMSGLMRGRGRRKR